MSSEKFLFPEPWKEMRARFYLKFASQLNDKCLHQSLSRQELEISCVLNFIVLDVQKLHTKASFVSVDYKCE